MKDLVGFGKYVELRDKVSEQPRFVIENGGSFIRAADERLAPRLLAVIGSAFRKLLKLDEAGYCFRGAETLAAKNQDDWALADTWQRMAFVYYDCGEVAISLKLAENAAITFNRLQDRAGLGRATLDQGIWQGHLGHYEYSKQLFEASLELLPPSEQVNRVSAVINLTSLADRMGDHSEMLIRARQIRQMRDIPLVIRGSAHEVLGRVASRKREWNLALRHFKAAQRLFSHGSFSFEEATLMVVLCRALLEAGRISEIPAYVERAKVLTKSVRNKFIASVLWDLAVTQARGEEISLNLLAGLHEQLSQEISRSAQRSPVSLPASLRTRSTG